MQRYEKYKGICWNEKNKQKNNKSDNKLKKINQKILTKKERLDTETGLSNTIKTGPSNLTKENSINK